MNTFLPYPDFQESAECLDYRRLGKQRVEALQLLRGQWANHPCSKMWRGYEHSLAAYGIAICEEWIRRGYKDTCLAKVLDLAKTFQDTGSPPWLGNPAVHLAFQSNLVRKKPEHYKKFWPDVPDNLPYIWSVAK